MNLNLFCKIADEFSLTAFDIGARGGAKSDLDLIRSAIHAVLFEPEREAYERLEGDLGTEGWRHATGIDTALAGQDGCFQLNLYRQRGCSSRYRADAEAGALFNRGDYYIHDGEVQVKARALDGLVREGRTPSPDFIKIDVQGMENEVFEGASTALRETVVGIRTEVSFFPIYPGQPLFAEVDLALRPYGFVPMRWVELHEWRRQTRVKYPDITLGPVPASRGQMMHADVLYLLHPEGQPSETEAEQIRLIRLGLVAACFGHIDHAIAAMSRPGVTELVVGRTGIDPVAALQPLSQRLAAQSRPERVGRRLHWLLRRFFASDA